MKSFSQFVKESFAGYNSRGMKDDDPSDQKAAKAALRKRAVQACVAQQMILEDKLKNIKSMKDQILGLSDKDMGEIGWDEAKDLPAAKIHDMFPDFKIEFRDGVTGYVIRFVGRVGKIVARSGYV